MRPVDVQRMYSEESVIGRPWASTVIDSSESEVIVGRSRATSARTTSYPSAAFADWVFPQLMYLLTETSPRRRRTRSPEFPMVCVGASTVTGIESESKAAFSTPQTRSTGKAMRVTDGPETGC